MKLFSSLLVIFTVIYLNTVQKCNEDAQDDNKPQTIAAKQTAAQDNAQKEITGSQNPPEITNDLLPSDTESKKEYDKVNITGWEAPAWADTLQSPFQNDPAASEKGKITYKQMCSICHGEEGKGDGVAGINLNPPPTDYSSEKVQNQSDGAIYWKITKGKSPMASYKQTLSDMQRWQLVNYIRKLGIKQK